MRADLMIVPQRHWSWLAFTVGLVIGIPIGAVALIVLLQILTVVISP